MIKAFTIIELLIVISLIGLIFGIGLNISNKPIEDTKSQYSRDAFIDEYNKIITDNLNSKWYNGIAYSNIQMQIYSGNSSINVIYNLENNTSGQNQVQIKIDNFSIYSNKDYLIFLKPYNIGCEIYTNQNKENKLTGSYFDISSNNGYKYNLKILDSDCKITMN